MISFGLAHGESSLGENVVQSSIVKGTNQLKKERGIGENRDYLPEM